MAGLWITHIKKKVFSRITSEFPESLKTKYKMQKVTANGVTIWRNFSQSAVSDTKPVFPYVTVVELQGNGAGRDLEGKTINAGDFYFQVDVYDNAKESTTEECMDAIVEIMTSMGFETTKFPAFDSRPQEYRSTATFYRTIGASDIF